MCTWVGCYPARVATRQGGSFASHRFNTPGLFGPRIGVSAGNVYVGWTATNRVPTTTFVAERVGTAWSGTRASPVVPTRDQELLGIAPKAGVATALNVSITARLYATNET